VNPFCIHTDFGDEGIPLEIVLISLGMPFGFNRHENTKYWKELLAPMMDDARTIRR
jgi:hypothetical protein